MKILTQERLSLLSSTAGSILPVWTAGALEIGGITVNSFCGKPFVNPPGHQLKVVEGEYDKQLPLETASNHQPA